MKRSGTGTGLVIAVVAAATFGSSGSLVKPMLDAGWTPAAAVTARALVGGVLLLPVALVQLRGRYGVLLANWRRILVMALIGVAGCQLAYFAAIERLPVGTAILLEYMAPLLLVGVAWARSRRVPQTVVLVGSGVALVGLVLVVAPSAGSAGLDGLGLVFGVLAMIGCAIYYVVAAAPSGDLPPVALAAAGLVIGGVVLGIAGVARILPFAMSVHDVAMFGGERPWWLPVLLVGVVSTAIAYTANITASELLGSRLASFAGLLEVVAATLYAWILLGQDLTWVKLAGGVLILAGIAFVRSERPGRSAPTAEPVVTGPIDLVRT
ncbi:EamA family transporter [Frondihabitans australicus]|uniref:Threonine/homoserine efflux transporter RhtA n=1 Tax=Frondihabitans australicus TaxID=386892 RepID=A0A495IEH0_9MICO|nr:DMT family transporter [Frondihabitans australicus]RKR74404.1 threonine/homoserine efflux transporter RhtA [Frondihabitans australicus]